MQAKSAQTKEMAKAMIPKLESALDDWNNVDGTMVAQLLDPGIKDTLLSADEKVLARQKFTAVFSKYAGQQNAPVPAAERKPMGGSIRDGLMTSQRFNCQQCSGERRVF